MLLLALISSVFPAAVATEHTHWDRAYGDDAPKGVPEWIPPGRPKGAAIDRDEYILMWNGMETIPGDATDAISGNYSQEEFLHIAAARQDHATVRPPAQQVEWNENADTMFQETSQEVSKYPTGTELAKGKFIQDAYIRLGEITPSTYYHDDRGQELRVRDHGGMLLASDYRIRPPKEKVKPGEIPAGADGSRVTVELVRLNETNIGVFAGDKNIVKQTSSGYGGNYVTYEDLPEAEPVSITVTQTFSVEFIRTVEYQVCRSNSDGTERDDRQGENQGQTRNQDSRTESRVTQEEAQQQYSDTTAQETCEWVTAKQERLTENVTVSDSITVSPMEPSSTRFRYRPGPETTYIQLPNSDAWSSVSVGEQPNTSTISDEQGFMTKRDQDWDTFRTSTETRTSDPQYHPFTPVQVHALPVYNGSQIYNSKDALRIQKRSESTGEYHPQYESPPYNVNPNIGAGAGYKRLDHVTVSVDSPSQNPRIVPSAQADRQTDIVLHPYVYNGETSGQVVRLEPTQQANLSLDITPVYASESSTEPSGYDVTVRLTEAATGDPIQTVGTGRSIDISDGRTVETNKSGIATYRANKSNFTFMGGYARFSPQGPFEGPDHYTQARASDAAQNFERFFAATANSVWTASLRLLFALLPGVAIVYITNIVLQYGRDGNR